MMTSDTAMTEIEISEIIETEEMIGTRDMVATETETESTEGMIIGTLGRAREMATGLEADQAAEMTGDTLIEGIEEIIDDLETGIMVDKVGGMVETEASVIEGRKQSNMKMMVTRIQI